jgi:hypothetical protein
MCITGIFHSSHTYTKCSSTYVHDLPLVPLVPLAPLVPLVPLVSLVTLVPLVPLVYLLGTLLAVSGSVHLCSLLLVN